jgi:hypothetical protein
MSESVTKCRMGRPPLNIRPMVVRLGKDIPERIDDVLQDKESRASFIRKAVNEELKRREQASSRRLPLTHTTMVFRPRPGLGKRPRQKPSRPPTRR